MVRTEQSVQLSLSICLSVSLCVCNLLHLSKIIWKAQQTFNDRPACQRPPMMECHCPLHWERQNSLVETSGPTATPLQCLASLSPPSCGPRWNSQNAGTCGICLSPTG